METSVGRDISASPQSAQAAAVTEWLKRTRPPAGYVFVIEDYARRADGIARDEVEGVRCMVR